MSYEAPVSSGFGSFEPNIKKASLILFPPCKVLGAAANGEAFS